MINEFVIYDFVRQALWIAFVISLPVLSVALLTGLLIGMFQAMTSIQELTLTFVPKLGAMMLVYWLTMSFMTETLVSYFQSELIPVIAGAR